MVIAVDEDQDAEIIARDSINDAVRDMSSWDFDLKIIDYKKGNANGWDGDSLPYGGDGETSISGYGG